MRKSTFRILSVAIVLFGNSFALASEPNQPVAKPAAPIPHCEVPCGIYADQMRFEMMLEDTATIDKAIKSIVEITGKMSEGPSATDINQVSRWVANKESHATNTQHIVSQYFLTQKIKAGKENYGKQLEASHAILVAAMKCKQDANPETTKALKKAIYDLYRAYEGKEPKFHEEK